MRSLRVEKQLLELCHRALVNNMQRSGSVPPVPPPTQTSWNLSDQFLGDDGCVAACEALRNNRTINEINLKGNNIHSTGAAAISNLLKTNPVIESISLEWNRLGVLDEGIQIIASSIEQSASLARIDLRNNSIGPSGAAVLATALAHNVSLKEVDLRWNSIGVQGGRALAEAMSQNSTIIKMELAGNRISDDSRDAIDAALKRNLDAIQREAPHSRLQMQSSSARVALERFSASNAQAPLLSPARRHTPYKALEEQLGNETSSHQFDNMRHSQHSQLLQQQVMRRPSFSWRAALSS
jgi:hypothetical protein